MSPGFKVAFAVAILSRGAFWGQSVFAADPVLAPGVRPGAQRMEAPAPAPAVAPTDLFQIPKVVDRPLDIDEGPTVAVTRFELVGFNAGEGPEEGPAEAQRIAESAIAERKGEFTIGQIQAVAAAISNYYRSKGFLYATTIVPVQDVQGGTVKLELLIGRLGKVKVEGNQRYRANILERPFNSLVGRPVEQESLESALIRVNDYPGLAVGGVMEPGNAPGEGNLVAKVRAEKPYDLSVGGDNYGRRETGRGRLNVLGNLHNPLGIGDELAVYFQHTVIPENGKFVDASYIVPLWTNTHLLRLFYRFNDFDIDDLTESDRQIAGVTDEGGFEFTHRWVRGRYFNLSTFEGLSRKTAETEIDALKIARNIVSVLHARMELDFVDRRFAGANSLILEYRRGIPSLFGALSSSNLVRSPLNPDRLGGSGLFATGKFDTYHASLYRLQSLSIISEALARHSLMFRVDGQYSNARLVPFEQFAAGGMQSVRAYETSFKLFDKGLFGSVEYLLPVPFIGDKPGVFGRTWGELVQLSAFYDYAWGVVNDPPRGDDGADKRPILQGAGVAVAFNVGTRFTSKVSLARTLNDRYGVKPDPRVWLQMNYAFF